MVLIMQWLTKFFRINVCFFFIKWVDFYSPGFKSIDANSPSGTNKFKWFDFSGWRLLVKLEVNWYILINSMKCKTFNYYFKVGPKAALNIVQNEVNVQKPESSSKLPFLNNFVSIACFEWSSSIWNFTLYLNYL